MLGQHRGHPPSLQSHLEAAQHLQVSGVLLAWGCLLRLLLESGRPLLLPALVGALWQRAAVCLGCWAKKLGDSVQLSSFRFIPRSTCPLPLHSNYPQKTSYPQCLCCCRPWPSPQPSLHPSPLLAAICPHSPYDCSISPLSTPFLIWIIPPGALPCVCPCPHTYTLVLQSLAFSVSPSFTQAPPG